jgi:AmmeMemoRadiSam system protein B
MTHYEPQDVAQRKDKEAIQAIIELDEDKLMEKIQQLGISMCGYAPVAVMLSLAKQLGAKTAKLIKYQTSGDVTGDRDSVVGYAGIVIY